jgi:tetratricopeptide (TPR) repeat protein
MSSKKKKSKEKGVAQGKNTVSAYSDQKPASSSERVLLFAIILFVLTLVVYVPSLKNGWTNWDDEGYVLDNPLVKSIDLSAIFSSYVMGNYHPVTVLAQAIEYHFFGKDASGFHAISLLLHLLNGLLLFYFVFRLTGKSWAALICALLFVLHPLHVESVSWVSAQKDLLYTFFYFLSMVFYLRYRQSKAMLDYGIVMILFILSLLSKAQAVTLPVIMLLVDWYQSKKITLKSIAEKLPFFILAVIAGIVAIIAQKESESIQDITKYPFTDRLLFSSYALVNYLTRLIMPLNLSAYYPYPEKTGSAYPWLVYTAPLILILIAFLIYRFRKKHPYLLFGILFFFTNILLVLQLLPVGGAITADRYAYLSFTGLFFIIAIAVTQFSETKKESLRSFRIPAVAVFSIWLIFISWHCAARTKIWFSSETLWKDVIAKNGRVPIAHNDLGSYYQKQQQLGLAKEHFDAAIRLQPDFPNALINRSDLYRNLNKIDSAIIDAGHAVRLEPDNADAHMNRGIAFSIAGKTDSAMLDFRKVIKLQPSNARAYNNRGNLFMIKEMPDSALINYDLALKYNPGFSEVYNNRGIALFKTGKNEEAIKDLAIAIQLSPNNANNYYYRMQAYEKAGQFKKALADGRIAVNLGIQIPPEYLKQLEESQ